MGLAESQGTNKKKAKGKRLSSIAFDYSGEEFLASGEESTGASRKRQGMCFYRVKHLITNPITVTRHKRSDESLARSLFSKSFTDSFFEDSIFGDSIAQDLSQGTVFLH